MAQDKTLKKMLDDLLNAYDKLVIDIQRWGNDKDAVIAALETKIKHQSALIAEKDALIQAQNQTMATLLNFKDTADEV